MVQTRQKHDFCRLFKQECWSKQFQSSKVPDLNLEVSSLELNASPSKLQRIRQESECDP